MVSLEELKELVSYKLSDYKNDATLFLRLDSVYRTFNRSSLCCVEQVESALLQLSNRIAKIETQNTYKNMPNKFILKPDSLLYSEKKHKYYAPSTITDEEAVELLAGNKIYARYFETLPEGWENLVEDYANQAPKKRKKATEPTQEVPQVLVEDPAQEETSTEAEETGTEEKGTPTKAATSTKKKKKK